MKKVIFPLILIIVSIGMGAPQIVRWLTYEEQVKQIESVLYHSPEKVLIASKSTLFKDKIIKRLETYLQSSKLDYKLIDTRHLPKENPDNYNAVIILTSAFVWSVDPKVEKFIQNRKNRENLILLITSEGEDVLPLVEGGYTPITSASDNPEKISDLILWKLAKTLNIE